MPVLVINSGSSSIKFSVFSVDSAELGAEPSCLLDGEVSGVGGGAPLLSVQDPRKKEPSIGASQVKAGTPLEATKLALDEISKEGMPALDAVGYRVVHPGPKLNDHQRITEEVLRDLEEAEVFAPLHDPAVLSVIRETMARFPTLPHYACFDTVFHGTMPEEASTYPIPEEYRRRGVRRYGFHGLSCESVLRQMRRRRSGQGASAPVALPRRMVIAHLGSGCSVTAVVDGRSVDTTMGLTPTGGVVMGTRPGDLDPGLVLYLLRQQPGEPRPSDDRGKEVTAVETMLNHASGMVALSGRANDVKALRTAAAEGDQRAILALRIFTRSVTKAIGGFSWLVGGLDAIVFTGGIGEHDSRTRAEVLSDLESAGVCVEPTRNESDESGERMISSPLSQVTVCVVPAQEDLMIAVHVKRMLDAETHPTW